MSEDKIKKVIEEIIQEIEQEMDEHNVTGNIAGYQTPHAFASKKDKKRRKKTATQLGYELVDDIDESYKGNLSDFKTDIINALDKVGISPKALKKVSKKGKGFEVRMSSYMKNKDAWEKFGKEMGAELVDFKQGTINIGLYETIEVNERADYKFLTQTILDAKPKHNVYYNSGHNKVNIGGVGYDGGDLVKNFNQKPGSSSKIKNNFYYADQDPQKTKREVEKLSNGKIKVDIQKGYGGKPMAVYMVKENRDSNMFYVLYQKKGVFGKPSAAGYKNRKDAEKFAKSLGNNHNTMILDKQSMKNVKGVDVKESFAANQINEWKLQLDLGKVNPSEFEKWADSSLQKKHKIKVSGSGKNWTITGKGNDDRMGSSANWIAQLLGKSWKGGNMRVVHKESVNEAKQKRPVNRWLELKNDETMHPHKKMAMGLKELKYQLAETEKFFNWYNKIKTMNELDSTNYWKRTQNHIYKIKERLINIAKTIQEIEK